MKPRTSMDRIAVFIIDVAILAVVVGSVTALIHISWEDPASGAHFTTELPQR